MWRTRTTRTRTVTRTITRSQENCQSEWLSTRLMRIRPVLKFLSCMGCVVDENLERRNDNDVTFVLMCFDSFLSKRMFSPIVITIFSIGWQFVIKYIYCIELKETKTDELWKVNLPFNPFLSQQVKGRKGERRRIKEGNRGWSLSSLHRSIK